MGGAHADDRTGRNGAPWWLAVPLAVAVALVVNLGIRLVALAAGLELDYEMDGTSTTVTLGDVAFYTVAPMVVGLTAAAVLSYLWLGIVRVAQVVGTVLAIGTVAMPLMLDGNPTTHLVLAVMHVVLAPILVIALEAGRLHRLHRLRTRRPRAT